MARKSEGAVGGGGVPAVPFNEISSRIAQMSFPSSPRGTSTKNLGLTHAVVPHKMYSLSKYRGKDGRVWKKEGGCGGEGARRRDRGNREKYRGSLEYPFEYD